MKEQKCTSTATSVNSNKLPAIFKKIKFSPGDLVQDWGSGKYIDHIREYVESKGCQYHPYDPYNLPGSEIWPCDVVVCSNVLNVIDSDDVLVETIHDITYVGKMTYISVYEGDGSGVGKETKKDCYQRNQKLSWYFDKIVSLGYHPTMKNGVITIDNMYEIELFLEEQKQKGGDVA